MPISQQNVACGQFCVWAANSQKVSIIVFVVQRKLTDGAEWHWAGYVAWLRVLRPLRVVT